MLGLRMPRARVLALLVFLSGTAVYAHTLGHGFGFDDGPEVVDNEWIQSLSDLPAIFMHSAWKGAGDEAPIYRPLATATYALNYAAGGLSPFGYHLANVLLHALTSVLVMALALELRMPLGAAALAGFLFAVHPVHAEVVANVAGRKDSLATLFAIAALLAHARALRSGKGWMVAAPAALAAAMLSKETGVAAIGLMAARDVLFGREEWRRARPRAIALYAAYGLLFLGYLGARWATVGSLGVPLDHIPFTENPIAHVGTPLRVLTAVAVLGRGIGLLLAPVKLSPDYSYRAIPLAASAAVPYALLAVAALAAATAAAMRSRRRSAVGAFALLWYGLTLFPASNLLFPVGTTFGERLLYLPSVGFCLGVSAIASALLATAAAPVLRWALPACAVALVARTATYAAVWADELALFSAGVEAQPESSKMRQCLGAALMERGQAAAALPQFQAVIRILQGTPAPLARNHLELGVAYEQLGRLDDAARAYEQALRDERDYPDALWRLGVVRWSQGRQAEAISFWLRTVGVDPRHARALSDLGIAYSLSGDDQAARGMWERATAADPRLASAWYRLGALYQRDGDVERARRAWREFLRHEHGKFPQEREEIEAKLRGPATP
jgi:tetratricopeptide (TPR) repeat protein